VLRLRDKRPGGGTLAPKQARRRAKMAAMAARILVIEDDDDVRGMLRALLEDEGYDVLEAVDGDAGLTCATTQHPDLVLLDLRLPGRHGFEICRALRAQHAMPIIIVTAQVDSHDVVAGLEAGADDYVTKPFVGKELSARIRANLRRHSGGAAASTFTSGDLEIRPDEGVVTRAGAPVALTKTEFRLLCEFAEHQGAVLSREQLLERVWGYDYLGDGRLVDAHIRRLRAKIEDDPGRPERLVTVRGLGYRLER
jgi:DNA-binding response OmpR family regulator